MALSEQAKERIGMLFEVAKTAFHWGFIPTVLYLGNTREFEFFTRKSMFIFAL
jgi:hypothetical protein